ncbi:hypothetical protein V6N12_007437 [Hibiscus sabdariffa]|uniref:Transposase MuDR plant domain-containing protein n=1 Tax=Hibiscus sabdariffa TaxID=183260 RepID=A0ABR2F1S4_9ROSI
MLASHELNVDANIENLRGRWGESLEDSSEDKDIGDPDLFPDDVGDAPDFGVGEIVPNAGDISYYEAPTHIQSVDCDAMRAPQFPDMPQVSSSQHGELFEGLQFNQKDEAILTIKDYTVRQHVDYTVVESNPRTFYAKCVKYGEGCLWKTRVTKLKKIDRWEVTKYNGNHTCL